MAYRCGGYASDYGHCGANDCLTCYPGGCSEDDEDREETSETIRYRRARKARPYAGILPGDLIKVTSGFSYKPKGERTGYLSKRYARIAKGPRHPDYDARAFAKTYLLMCPYKAKKAGFKLEEVAV